MALLLVALLATGPAAFARVHHAGRPDLRVTTLTGWGGRRVHAIVANLGASRSRASLAGFYLSRDSVPSAGDVRLARVHIPALGAGSRARVIASLPVPAGTAPGRYRLLACADDSRRIRESSERDNCLASRSFVTVAARPSVSVSASPGAPAQTPAPAPEPAPDASPVATPSPPAPQGQPVSVSLSSPADGAWLQSAAPTFTGTGVTSSFVIVTVASANTTETLTTLPASDGSWSVSASPTLPDGHYTVQALQTGPLGDTALSAVHGFDVDTTDPAVAVTLNPASPNGQNGIYSSLPVVHVTADDANFASLACTVDGTPRALVNQPPLSSHDAEGDAPVAGDGDHTVSCIATDRAGRETTQSRAFSVQSTTPIVSLVDPAAGTVTSDRTPTFDGTGGRAAGDVSDLTLDVYTGSAASGTPVQSLHATVSATDGSWSVTPGTNLPEGTYTAQAEQSNDAGGVGKSASHTFSVDATAPKLAISLNPSSPNGSNGFYTTMPTVHVSADDANFRDLACTVDGSAKALDAQDNLSAPATDGHHSVSCTATDLAGNSTTRTSSFDFDGAAPGVSLSDPSGAYVATGTPAFSGTAGIGSNDASTVTVSLSSGQTLSATVNSDGSWSVTPSTALPDGSYTAQAQQADQAGNVGHSTSRTFRVDTVNPTMSLTLNPSSPNGQNGIYKTMPAVHLTADDANFESVTCTVDGSSRSLVNQPTTPSHSAEGDLPVSGDGSHDVSCTARDLAGHSVTQAKSFQVDSTAPSPSVSSPTAGSTTDDQTVTIAGSAGTAAGDSTDVTVKVFNSSSALVQTLDGARAADGSWSVVTQALPVGTYSVRAEQSDSAGNTGVSGSRSFSTPAVMLAAGDIASCDQTGDSATAALLGQNPADAIVALGDNAYESGSASEFSSCYGPTWGAYKAKTHPAVGNHEYYDQTGDAADYFNYFGSAAGAPGQGWYSYDLGTWHIVVLNSSDECYPIGCAAGSAQETWLKQDLANHPAQCTLAYWHHPLFTSDALAAVSSSPEVKPFWNDLYAAGAEVVLNGHAHQYERFDPQAPDGLKDTARGITEFVAGTGGYAEHPLKPTPALNSVIRNNDTFGVLRLVLQPGGYSWRFVPQAGKTFTDSGSASCH